MDTTNNEHGRIKPSGTSAAGTLYGIGVGPGSPDLLTLRAVNILGSVPVVFAAASPKNDGSLALSIAGPHLAPDTTVMRLDFPMTRDRAVLEKAWELNARKVADVLRSGASAAFLTLGDPLIYSTFGYLMQTLQSAVPEADIRVIPGITSFQEAAAKTRTVLCEGEENFLLISGINDASRLRENLAGADSAVILKAYRNFPVICRTLEEAGKKENAVLASRIGMPGEVLERVPEEDAPTPPYLSLLLVPPARP